MVKENVQFNTGEIVIYKKAGKPVLQVKVEKKPSC